MMFTSQEISQKLDITSRYIRVLTQKATDIGISSITCKGETFNFTKVAGIGGRGWVYRYEQVAKIAQKPQRKAHHNHAINLALLPKFVDLNKPTIEEKLAIVSFYNLSNHPLSHIVKTLIIEHHADIKPASLQAKIKRWVKLFKEKGRSGLEDKRGGKAFKADLDLVKFVLLGGGTRHYTSLYMFYCHEYAKRHNLAFNIRKPSADISESAFNRAAKHVIANNQLVKEYLQIGEDAFVYAEPSYGRQWEYPNQQWEVDATKMDMMVKVPVVLASGKKNQGHRDYFIREATADYQLVRLQIIGIIDNFSGSTVYALFDSSNSYANARLLHKAMKKLGKPEIIKGDNGADYVSAHLQAVLADLAIDYIATGKARGDEKGMIERSFRTLQHSPEFECMAGFVGHNVDQRQHLEMESSTKLEKLSGVATNIKSDHLWWWEAENWLDNFMEHKQSNRYEKHSDCLPTQRELDVAFRLLGKRENRKVSKEGIRHNNSYYLSLEMWQHIQIGEHVEIIENIDNASLLSVYQHGQFVCEIQNRDILRQSLSVEQIKASKKIYKQRVVKENKSLTKQAHKSFKGLQNELRDEFLAIETAQVEIKKEFEQDTTDYTEELRKLAAMVG